MAKRKLSPEKNSPSIKKISPSSMKNSPSFKKNSPSSKKISPSSMKNSPSSKKISPSSMKTSPSFKKNSPSSKQNSPSSKKNSPSFKKISPSKKSAPSSKMNSPPSKENFSSPKKNFPSSKKSPPSSKKVSPSMDMGVLKTKPTSKKIISNKNKEKVLTSSAKNKDGQINLTQKVKKCNDRTGNNSVNSNKLRKSDNKGHLKESGDKMSSDCKSDSARLLRTVRIHNLPKVPLASVVHNITELMLTAGTIKSLLYRETVKNDALCEIEFTRPEEASAALLLNGALVCGFCISVSISRKHDFIKDKKCGVLLLNIPKDCKSSHIHKALSVFGKVGTVEFFQNPDTAELEMCSVQFTKQKEASAACKVGQVLVKRKSILVCPKNLSRSNRVVFCFNLPHGTSKQKIREFFGDIPISGVLFRSGGQLAIVSLQQEADIAKALQLNGTKLYKHKVKVIRNHTYIKLCTDHSAKNHDGKGTSVSVNTIKKVNENDVNSASTLSKDAEPVHQENIQASGKILVDEISDSEGNEGACGMEEMDEGKIEDDDDNNEEEDMEEEENRERAIKNDDTESDTEKDGGLQDDDDEGVSVDDEIDILLESLREMEDDEV